MAAIERLTHLMLVYTGMIPVHGLTPTERAAEDPRHEGRKGYRAYQIALAGHIREHGFPGRIEIAHEPATTTRAGYRSYIADGHHRWRVAEISGPRRSRPKSGQVSGRRLRWTSSASRPWRTTWRSGCLRNARSMTASWKLGSCSDGPQPL